MREIRMIMEGSGYEITSLKDAGIKVMETGFYETEAPACGCGAKLDHRDFGPNGKIDRPRLQDAIFRKNALIP